MQIIILQGACALCNAQRHGQICGTYNANLCIDGKTQKVKGERKCWQQKSLAEKKRKQYA